MKNLILSGAAVAALFAAPAVAQPSRTAPAPPRASLAPLSKRAFANASPASDANRDGFVTQEEAQAFRAAARTQRQGSRVERRGDRAGNREAMFVRLDANRDGMISREEFNQPRAGMQQGERRAMRGARRGRERAASALEPSLASTPMATAASR
jgi:hypothetical protein